MTYDEELRLIANRLDKGGYLGFGGADQAVTEIKAAALRRLPEKPTYPSVDVYVAMVREASENNKYDDMYDNGYLLAIQDMKDNLGEGK